MRQRVERCADVGDDGRHVARAVAVGDHGDTPLPAFALDLVRPRRLFDAGEQAQRHMMAAGSDEQLLQPRGRAVLVGKAQDDVEAPVALDDLRDHAAVGQAFERLRHGRGADAVKREPLVVDDHAHLGDARLPLDLQIGEAGDTGQPLAHAFGEALQPVEIGTEHFDDDFGTDTRLQMIEPMRDRLPDVDRRPARRRAARGCRP